MDKLLSAEDVCQSFVLNLCKRKAVGIIVIKTSQLCNCNAFNSAFRRHFDKA